MDIEEINECLWDGIIKLEWNFEITLRKFWIQLRTSNSPDFIILDLIMRIYFTNTPQMRIINIDFFFIISGLWKKIKKNAWLFSFVRLECTPMTS